MEGHLKQSQEELRTEKMAILTNLDLKQDLGVTNELLDQTCIIEISSKPLTLSSNL